MQSVKINTTGDREKGCSVCGGVFTCSTTDCWCSKLPAVMPMDGKGDCYCPRCLKEMIDHKIADQANIISG